MQKQQQLPARQCRSLCTHLIKCRNLLQCQGSSNTQLGCHAKQVALHRAQQVQLCHSTLLGAELLQVCQGLCQSAVLPVCHRWIRQQKGQGAQVVRCLQLPACQAGGH